MRHPIHLFNNVRDYTATFERSREFTLSFELNGVKIPWFAAKWAEEFSQSSIADRALISIARMQDTTIKSIGQIQSTAKLLLVLSFEKTVLDPENTIRQLENFLDRTRTKRTNKVLKQQSLPRKQISAGKATSSFSFTSNTEDSEAEIYQKVVAEISTSGSASAIAEFKLAIDQYNKRWPSPLAELERSWGT